MRGALLSSGRMAESPRKVKNSCCTPKVQLPIARAPHTFKSQQLAKQAAGVVDYLPFKAIYNGGREAVGAGPRVAEIEVLNPSGKRVAAATATRKGEATFAQGDQITWSEMQSITDYWANSFRLRLNELRGVAPSG